MTLTADEVAARARRAILTVDDDYYDDFGPDGQLLVWPAGSEEALQTSIGKILAAYPHLADSLGYAWTVAPSAYRTLIDAEFQRYVLELIADVDTGHPAMIGAKPVAARMAINRDFISYAQPGRELDFIFVGRGFMDVLKYFMEMTVDIMELAPATDHQPTWWGPANLAEIRRNHQRSVTEAVALFIVQSMNVVEGKFPRGSRPIWDRLSSKPSLTPLTYEAVESFVVAHELAHLLERHDVRDRALNKEINADWAAVSLLTARHGTQKRVYGSMHTANAALNIGGPAFYLLGSLYHLIVALCEWKHGRTTEPHLQTVIQLHARWFFYRELATSDSVRIPAQVIDECSRNIRQMVNLCLDTLHAYWEKLASDMGRPLPSPYQVLLQSQRYEEFLESLWEWQDWKWPDA